MKWVLTVLLTFFSFNVWAEDVDSVQCADTARNEMVSDTEKDIWGVSVAGNVSYLIHAGEYNKELLHSYGTNHYDLRLRWQPRGRHETAYDRAMGHPTILAGLIYEDFARVKIYRNDPSHRARIGYLLSLYGGVQFNIVRKGRWAIGLDLMQGIAYCPHPFDENSNRDNEVIGSTFSIFFGAGVSAKYRFAPRWHASIGLDFKHYSNGTLDRPNLGANTIGPTLALHYDLGNQEGNMKGKGDTKTAPLDKGFRKGFYVDAVAGMGLKSLIDHFTIHQSKDNPLYGFFTTMVAPMYRYHLLHASGIGLDYTYADYIYKVRDYDRLQGRTGYRYSPHILGISARHEVFYRHFSVNVGVGIYLLNHTGHIAKTEESRIYQNVGLRYAFPFTHDRVFIGYNIKAHRFQKVNCVQILLGCRV